MVSGARGTNGADRLVGRRGELRAFETALTAARSGASAALALVGEPGIGKTHLLDELSRRAVAQGFQVLVGRGTELEQDVPFGVVVDALDASIGQLDRRTLARLGEERLAELGAVLPSFAAEAANLTSPLEIERYRSHQAIRLALAQLSRHRPLLLALDDVHWADPASIELVSHLLRRGAGQSLLALTYRPAQAPPLLERALDIVEDEGTLQRLQLVPFTLSETRQLLGQEPDATTLETLYREGGGNPFYLTQLARAGVDKERADPERAQDAVPQAVRTAVLRELDALPTPARLLLEAAAVIGEPFDVDLAGVVSELDESATLDAMDELTHADLVRLAEPPARFAFRHPIVRRVAYDAARPGWRLGAHRRAARALAQRGAWIGARANHVARSAVDGDLDAIAVLTEAGNAAAPRAPAAAARWFESALQLLPDDADAAQRMTLLLGLATALASTGQLHESRTALWSAAELLAPGDADRAAINVLIARIEQGLGNGREARAAWMEALRQTDPRSREAIARTLELAESYLMLTEWDVAAREAARARELAKQLSDPVLSFAASALGAHIEQMRGAVGAANVEIDAAAESLDRMPDSGLTPAMLPAVLNLALAEFSTERIAASARHGERGLQACRATGQGQLLMGFLFVLSLTQLFGGDLDEAHHTTESAVEAALLLDNDQWLATAASMHCWVLAWRGDLAGALTAGELAKGAALRAPQSLNAWLGHAVYGEALIASGRADEGRAEILTASGPDMTRAPVSARVRLVRLLVEAELAGGRVDAAAAALDRLDAGDEVLRLMIRAGDAHIARAMVLLARDDAAEAAEAADAAVRCYHEVGVPLEAARARLLRGRALARAGEATAATKELALAQRALAAGGAAGLAAQAAGELRRMRRRRVASDDDGLGGLTPRQREIAELVAEGKTNQQIGIALNLSERTVEKHLGNAFTKLGVSSRAAVAAAFVRAGAAGTGEPSAH